MASYLGQTIRKPDKLHMNFRYSEQIRLLGKAAPLLPTSPRLPCLAQIRLLD